MSLTPTQTPSRDAAAPALEQPTQVASGGFAGLPKQKLFLSSFVVALLLFFAANAAVGRLASVSVAAIDPANFQNSPAACVEGRPASWWITHSVLSETTAPQIFLFGSSQLGGVSAADAKLLNKNIDWVLDHRCQILQRALAERSGSAVSVFTCGLPGAMISDHYLISRALFPFKKPSMVILTVAPRDFIDNFLPDISSTEPYRFFSRYLRSDSVVRRLSTVSWTDRLQNDLAALLPLKNGASALSLRTTVDAILDTIHLVPSGTRKDSQSQNGWLFSLNSDNDCVKPGQCVVLPEMPKVFIDNSGEYAKRYRNCNPPFYKQELEYFREYLKFCHQQNIRVLVVDMPLTELNRKLLPPVFWASYKSGLSGACKEYNASYLDLSTDSEFTLHDFVDTVHLNAAGGAKLADKLAGVVTSNKELADSLSPAH